MNSNEGIIRILDSTSQSAPKMAEALADYGNGCMGVGLLKFADWARQVGKAQGLQQGRIEGALATGVLSTTLFVVSSLFMLRQFRKEEQRNQDAMFDLLDDVATMKAEMAAVQRTDSQRNEADASIAGQEKEEI